MVFFKQALSSASGSSGPARAHSQLTRPARVRWNDLVRRLSTERDPIWESARNRKSSSIAAVASVALAGEVLAHCDDAPARFSDVTDGHPLCKLYARQRIVTLDSTNPRHAVTNLLGNRTCESPKPPLFERQSERHGAKLRNVFGWVVGLGPSPFTSDLFELVHARVQEPLNAGSGTPGR